MKAKLVRENLNEYNISTGSRVSELFPWYVKTLTKYGLDDSVELITDILMKASGSDWSKEQVYNKLIEKGVDMSPEATKELFSKFDELVRDSYRL